MSHQTISCKLPLLDGDGKASPQVITVDTASDSVRELQGLYSSNISTFESYLYTAWALLLRCYTGQDHVCFQLCRTLRVRDSDASAPSPHTVSLLQLALREDETLSDIIRRVASDVFPTSSTSDTASPQHSSESASPSANTTVKIYDEDHGRSLAAADASGSLEVSKSPESSNRADFCIRVKLRCLSV